MKTGAIALLIMSLLAPAAAGDGGTTGFFTDDDNSVHVRSIEAIADEGVTLGCNPPTNDRFCPEDSVTRGQMATFLVRALGLGAGTATFDDISGSVYAADISALASAGITKGCNPPDNTLYCPNDPVTRDQMATFLVRALELDPGTATFDDISGSVHAADISALASAGVTKGCNPPDNNLYCPRNEVTREQMASFLARGLGYDTSPRIVITQNQDLGGMALGTAGDEVVATLSDWYGAPTDDYMDACPYFLPDPNMRYVRWGSLIAVIRTVDDGEALGLAGWRYKLDDQGDPEPGGPLAEHIEMPFGLELGDPIGDAVDAGGGPIATTNYGWIVAEFDDFTVEASGLSVDPDALIDGVQQGFGFDCE
jgi:hypothetical protein